MKKIKPEILIDCDGVMGDTIQHVLNLIDEKLGLKFSIEDVTDHQIFKALGIPEHEHIWDKAIEYDEHCLKIPVFAEAKNAIIELREFAEVFCITAPHVVKPWMHHREQWLIENMGFERSHIMQIKSKYMVPGDMFIDDRQENVESWHARHQDKLAILFETPYNHLVDGVIRTRDWNKIVELAREIK
jgi:5'(3')-deoxyribonucleotidase